MHAALESGTVFVYGCVEGLERAFWQVLLVLLADVNAGFLKGVDEGGIGSHLGHSVDKNFPDLGIAEIRFSFAALLRLHSEQIIPWAGVVGAEPCPLGPV